MRVTRFALILSALSAGTACSSVDPITRYEFVQQWLGDGMEQGATVCGVGRARRHVLALPHDPALTCQPQEYSGSVDVYAALSDPPPNLDPLGWDLEREPLPGPVTRVRAYGEWSVGLVAVFGLAIDRFESAEVMTHAFDLHLADGAPLTDLEVDGPWAFVTDGVADLIVVSLEALPEPTALARVAMGGVPRDVYVDGDRAAVLVDNTLVMVDLTDRSEPVARGRLALTGLVVDGVGLRGEHAYLAAEGSLYTVDVADLDAPRLLREAGVESTSGGIALLYGNYLFQAPGFDTPLAVTSIEDPSQPNPFWAFMGGNGVFDVAAAGETLYLATGSGGVQAWGLGVDEGVLGE